MSRVECAQQILIEALHDKRLSEQDAASLRRHQKSCAVCRREAEQLRRLDRLGEQHGAELSRSELERRRGRATLLRAAAAPRREAKSIGGRMGLLAAAVTLAALLGLVLWPATLSAPAAIGLQPVSHALAEVLATVAGSSGIEAAPGDAAVPGGGASTPAIAVVRPLPRADYQREQRGATERVHLHDGTIDIEVQALRGEQRFVVATEDAEVEVRGTRFEVSAEQGQLRSVRVSEGRVELRYGRFAQMLGAGEQWSAESDGRTTSTADPAAAADAQARRQAARHPSRAAAGHARRKSALVAGAAPAAGPARGAGSARGVGPNPTAGSAADPASAAGTGASAAVSGAASAGVAHGNAPSAAARSFGAAMAHLEEGRYRQAHKQLSAFARKHAGDPRAEDADFLAIVALQRAGRHARAAEAARRYLRRYPQGARRREAAAIANAPRR